MAIIGTIYSSNCFMFHKDTNSFSAEISEVPTVLRQLWSTSMDLGFRMRSDKTGEIAFFTLKDCKRDSEGDLVEFVFEPTDDSVRRSPRLAGVKVHVYND